MKIALINENSQAAKNTIVETTLKKVVEPMGHEVFNYNDTNYNSKKCYSNSKCQTFKQVGDNVTSCYHTDTTEKFVH